MDRSSLKISFIFDDWTHGQYVFNSFEIYIYKNSSYLFINEKREKFLETKYFNIRTKLRANYTRRKLHFIHFIITCTENIYRVYNIINYLAASVSSSTDTPRIFNNRLMNRATSRKGYVRPIRRIPFFLFFLQIVSLPIFHVATTILSYFQMDFQIFSTRIAYTSRNSDKWLEGVERGWRSEICTRVKRTEGRRVVIGRRGGSIKKSISPFHDWTRGERPGERRAGRGTTSR